MNSGYNFGIAVFILDTNENPTSKRAYVNIQSFTSIQTKQIKLV